MTGQLICGPNCHWCIINFFSQTLSERRKRWVHSSTAAGNCFWAIYRSINCCLPKYARLPPHTCLSNHAHFKIEILTKVYWYNRSISLSSYVSCTSLAHSNNNSEQLIILISFTLVFWNLWKSMIFWTHFRFATWCL